jgi:hypothetical protein
LLLLNDVQVAATSGGPSRAYLGRRRIAGAERVLGVIIAELRAERGSRIYGTEVRAVARAERIVHAGYAFCILGSVNAVWAGESIFSNLGQNLSLTLAVDKRRTSRRDERGTRLSWRCS